MADWGQVNVTGSPALLVSGDGSPVLLNNVDASNTVWLTEDGFTFGAGDSTNASPLPPLGSVTFDGKSPVWGTCVQGQSALVSRYPGGLNFFQLVELLVKTLLVSAPAGNGVFEYSGAPGLGDLIFSITQALVDPFGNLTQPGVAAYDNAGGIASLRSAGILVSQGGHNRGQLSFVNAAAAFYLQAFPGFSQLMTDQLLAVTPGGSVPETPHLLTLDAGWTAGTGANPAPGYYMNALGELVIFGFATHAAFTGTLALNSSNPLPAAWRPAHNQRFGAYTVNGGCGMAVTTAGVIQTETAPASSTDVRFCSPGLPMG